MSRAALAPASCSRCVLPLIRLSRRPSARAIFQCRANYGFLENEPVPSEPASDIIYPSSAYGLSMGQMAAMGITGTAVERMQEGLTEAVARYITILWGLERIPATIQASLRASAFYVGDDAKVDASRTPATMRRGGGGGGGVLTPGRSPPDLPSLLLDARIVYIGMPLVASVTELIISELLWLNYNQPEKPMYVYINSAGSQSDNFEAVGFETEAYAILDTMQYVRPAMYTLVIGHAYGNALMLLAAGQKGKRASLPNSRLKMAPPRMNRSFGRTVDLMIKSNELELNNNTYVDFMTKFTGQPREKVDKDCGRDKYFTPKQAIEYGIIDRIVQPQEEVAMDRKDYEGALAQMRSQRGSRNGGGAPEAGSA